MDGANVFVELYTDRIEVSSPGGLPKGMVLSDLGHKSIRRNTLIGDLLHRIEFIEKAGTGIKRIRDEARSQGCPEPAFETSGFFTATFLPNPEVRAQALVQERRVSAAVGGPVGQAAGGVVGEHTFGSRTRHNARATEQDRRSEAHPQRVVGQPTHRADSPRHTQQPTATLPDHGQGARPSEATEEGVLDGQDRHHEAPSHRVHREGGPRHQAHPRPRTRSGVVPRRRSRPRGSSRPRSSRTPEVRSRAAGVPRTSTAHAADKSRTSPGGAREGTPAPNSGGAAGRRRSHRGRPAARPEALSAARTRTRSYRFRECPMLTPTCSAKPSSSPSSS